MRCVHRTSAERLQALQWQRSFMFVHLQRSKGDYALPVYNLA